MRRFPVPRPTEQRAIAAASRSSRTVTATAGQLQERALRAVETDDGHGLRLITAHLARAVA